MDTATHEKQAQHLETPTSNRPDNSNSLDNDQNYNVLASPPHLGFAKSSAWTVVAFIFIEFILGTALSTKNVGGSKIITNSAWFMSHAGLGVIIALLSITALVAALKSKQKSLSFWAGLGLIAILASGAGGMEFLLAKAATPWLLVMSIGFVISFTAYFIELYLIAHKECNY